MRRSTRSVTTNVLFVLGLTATISTTVLGQDGFKRLPPTKIAIDSTILASFTDEPCHHFEEARASLSASDSRQAAEHLRIGAAFLKLEASRATSQGRGPLTASINELQKLADAVEQGAVRTTSPLDAAFMRAHYALAGHHCIKAAHRCCQVGNLQNPGESQRASHDLSAAAKHLERASWWGQQDVDMETRELLQESHIAANSLGTNGGQAHGKATQAITALGGKLEALTGRKIMLAPQVTEADELGPSVFR